MKNKRPKVYISGQITGKHWVDYTRQFNTAEKHLDGASISNANIDFENIRPVNPLRILPPWYKRLFKFLRKITWQDYMFADLQELSRCDAIYLLDGWEKIRGAKVEYEWALKFGLKVIKASDAYKFKIKNDQSFPYNFQAGSFSKEQAEKVSKNLMK